MLGRLSDVLGWLSDVLHLRVTDDSLREFIDIAPGSEPSRQAYIRFVEGKAPDEVRYVASRDQVNCFFHWRLIFVHLQVQNVSDIV